MDFWTGKFEYDFKEDLDMENNLIDFNSDVSSISEIFAINENGDFVCAGDDFAEYVSIKRRAGTWL